MDRVSRITKDIILLQYIWKKYGKTMLLDKTHVENLTTRFVNEPLNYDNLLCTQESYAYFWSRTSLNIGQNVQAFSMLAHFLNIGNGKLSLCGLNIFVDPIPDTDLYLHSCTKEEANTILAKCLQYIEDDEDVYIQTNQNYILFNVDQRAIKIHRQIYQTKEQILMNFDFDTKQHGWNPIDGYFTTIAGAFSYAMRTFSLNPKLSLTFDDDLYYCIQYGYNILYSELSQPTEDIMISKYTVKNIDGKMMIDYNHSYDSRDNCTLISNNKDCLVEFDVPKQEVNDISSETIHENIATSKWVNTGLPNISFNEAKTFLGDQFNDYLIALATNVDDSIIIWNNQLNKYLDRAKVISESIRANPFIEYKHQYIPVTEPNTFYGKYHVRTQVGLDHDRFVQFYHCALMYNIPKDLFRLLCHYWLDAEYTDAHNRLMKYAQPQGQINVTIFDEEKGWYIDDHDFVICKNIPGELHVVGIAPTRSISIRELTKDEVKMAEKIGFIVDKFQK